MTLHGRDAERSALEVLLASGSGALVLRGEIGSGKTALLDHAAAHAGDLHVLRAAGSDAESELPFAAVDQLIRPLLELRDALAAEDAAAIRSIGSPVADRFAVCSAVLALLSLAAERRPLVCVVDDAHRIDPASLAAFAFVARRLTSERVVLLLATRDAAHDGLPELVLGPLHREAAARILDERLGDSPSPLVRERLLDAARGNPLALRELPGALTREQVAGRDRICDPLPVTRAVERLFQPELRRLDGRLEKLLLVLAADDRCDAAALRRATERLGIGWCDFDEAEAAGIVRSSASAVEFAHPLARSVVYHSASLESRRLAHGLLAEAHADADLRLWHRALATIGGDPRLAGELEVAAAGVARRRGHAAAASVLERAALLSDDDVERVRRLTDAAEACRLAGRPARAAALVREAARVTAEPVARAELERIRALVELQSGSPADAFAALLAAADDTGAVGEPRSLDLLLDAGEIAIGEGDARRQLDVARRAAALCDESFELAVALGAGEILAGQVADGTRLLRAALDTVDLSAGARRLNWAGAASLHVGDAEAARRFYAKLVATYREQGADGMVPVALYHLALAEAADGRFGAAAARAQEGLALAEETNQVNVRCHHVAVLAWVAAVNGREDDCRSLAREVFRLSAMHDLRLPVQIASAALGELELGLNRPDEALARLSEVSGYVVRRVVAPSLVEAAVRADRPDLADEVLEELEGWIDGDAPHAQRALLARCRGLCAAGDARDEHYVEAVRLHTHAGRTLDQARTRLLHGEALRRTRRRREARAHLQAALDAFERLDAESWAARARSELRGSGVTAQRGDPSLLDQLTPQELQVARLVAGGATNKQVAAQLYLSPRTIDFHLRNIFAKLGITSRFQLGAFRAEIEPGDVAGATLERAA